MKYLFLPILLLAGNVIAAPQVDLTGMESVTVFCNPDIANECPTPPVDIAYAHGGDHKRMTKLPQDCRTCHGADLQGTPLSTANLARTCIAPSKFRMPANVMDTERWITTWPDGEELNIVGTDTARVEVGDEVGCQMCHSEVEFHDANGREIEMRVRSRRSRDEDEGGSTTPPPTTGGGGTTGTVFACSAVHNSTRTCSNCHNDGRTCQ